MTHSADEIERVRELVVYLDAIGDTCFVVGGRRIYTDDLRAALDAMTNPSRLREALEAVYKFLWSEYYDAESEAMQGNPIAKEARDVWDIVCAALTKEPDDGRREKYNELLFAVARKFDGESRHETALRYIREREEMVSLPASPHKDGGQ